MKKSVEHGDLRSMDSVRFEPIWRGLGETGW